MSRPINRMDRLSDMAKFPWTVHLGASLNIVFSVWLTYAVFRLTGGSFAYFFPFAVGLIALNVVPVIKMRSKDTKTENYATLEDMDFFQDQHRFSTWVYAVASGNMLFWTAFAWWTFTLHQGPNSLLFVQSLAFAITYVPLWRRSPR